MAIRMPKSKAIEWLQRIDNCDFSSVEERDALYEELPYTRELTNYYLLIFMRWAMGIEGACGRTKRGIPYRHPPEEERLEEIHEDLRALFKRKPKEPPPKFISVCVPTRDPTSGESP